MSKKRAQSGPQGYQNWQMERDGAQLREVSEVQLYSDARFRGELVDRARAPYEFLNVLPTGNQPAHVATLRVRIYLDPTASALSEPDTKTNFHGGTLHDEATALASLLLGARLRAGSLTRLFHERDSYGRPEADRGVPHLAVSNPRVIAPSLCGIRNLNESLDPQLFTYADLKPSDAIALVRAARLYQDAVWIVESQPQLSWIFLVSAVEAVAATEKNAPKESASAVLRETLPELAELLLARGGEALLEDVAVKMRATMKAHRGFVDFMIRYKPEPPETRPEPLFCIDWEEAFLRPAMSKVYKHRSNALHAGTPFPAPMCWEGPAEKPTGLGAGTLGGWWKREDTPMLVGVFAYLVRGALLNWWRAKAPSS